MWTFTEFREFGLRSSLPAVGESQREGALASIALSCILSPQGRGEN
jgi:hypothetical protein